MSCKARRPIQGPFSIGAFHAACRRICDGWLATSLCRDFRARTAGYLACSLSAALSRERKADARICFGMFADVELVTRASTYSETLIAVTPARRVPARLRLWDTHCPHRFPAQFRLWEGLIDIQFQHASAYGGCNWSSGYTDSFNVHPLYTEYRARETAACENGAFIEFQRGSACRVSWIHRQLRCQPANMLCLRFRAPQAMPRKSARLQSPAAIYPEKDVRLQTAAFQPCASILRFQPCTSILRFWTFHLELSASYSDSRALLSLLLPSTFTFSSLVLAGASVWGLLPG